MSKPTDLVQGTLDLLIMKILALEPLHGWAIGQRLKQVSDDTLHRPAKKHWSVIRNVLHWVN